MLRTYPLASLAGDKTGIPFPGWNAIKTRIFLAAVTITASLCAREQDRSFQFGETFSIGFPQIIIIAAEGEPEGEGAIFHPIGALRNFPYMTSTKIRNV